MVSVYLLFEPDNSLDLCVNDYSTHNDPARTSKSEIPNCKLDNY